MPMINVELEKPERNLLRKAESRYRWRELQYAALAVFCGIQSFIVGSWSAQALEVVGSPARCITPHHLFLLGAISGASLGALVVGILDCCSMDGG